MAHALPQPVCPPLRIERVIRHVAAVAPAAQRGYSRPHKRGNYDDNEVEWSQDERLNRVTLFVHQQPFGTMPGHKDKEAQAQAAPIP